MSQFRKKMNHAFIGLFRKAGVQKVSALFNLFIQTSVLFENIWAKYYFLFTMLKIIKTTYRLLKKVTCDIINVTIIVNEQHYKWIKHYKPWINQPWMVYVTKGPSINLYSMWFIYTRWQTYNTPLFFIPNLASSLFYTYGPLT